MQYASLALGDERLCLQFPGVRWSLLYLKRSARTEPGWPLGGTRAPDVQTN